MMIFPVLKPDGLFLFQSMKRKQSRSFGSQNEPSPGRFDGLPALLKLPNQYPVLLFTVQLCPQKATKDGLSPPKEKKREEKRRGER